MEREPGLNAQIYFLLIGMRMQISSVLKNFVVHGTFSQTLCTSGVTETLQQWGYFYISYHMSASNMGYAGVAIFSKIRFTGFGEGVGDDNLDSEYQ